MNMEQTPVEWLAWKFAVTNIEEFKDNFNDIIEQAKQMENEKLESLKDFDSWKEWKNE